MSAKIKIYISCHKESQLPRNKLFEPIHVGAKTSKKVLADMIRDDVGDNISEKNPQYCELTAQYWAWKNDLNSDYIGLCHYRRFLCFTDVSKMKIVRNERKHIEAYAIDDFNLARFGLENEDEMRKIIESSDACVGELQRVSSLYTPLGKRNSAYEHWAAHDRDLIFKKDLDKMLSILDQEFPVFAKITRKYLKTNTFLGFNCFVMKRNLFEELCNIEFSVLKRLEESTDLNDYSLTQSRIYGFMGEIIFSAYIYYLEHQKKYKITHVPILYFNYTDKIQKILPLEKNNSYQILFLHRGREDFLFTTALESFIENMEKDVFYDILILSRMFSPIVKKHFSELIKPYQNISIRYLDGDLYRNQLKERFDVSDQDPFVPFFLPSFDKMFVFDSNIIFRKSITPLLNTAIENSFIVACPNDIVLQAKINGITSKFYKNVSMFKEKPLTYFFTRAFIWDFAKYRQYFSETAVVKAIAELNKIERMEGDVLNKLCDKYNQSISQEWSIISCSSDYAKQNLSRAPQHTFKEFQNFEKDPSIVCYEDDAPWKSTDKNFLMLFWKIARATPFYEILLNSYKPNTFIERTNLEKVIQSFHDDGLKITLNRVIRSLFSKKRLFS